MFSISGISSATGFEELHATDQTATIYKKGGIGAALFLFGPGAAVDQIEDGSVVDSAVFRKSDLTGSTGGVSMADPRR